MEGGWVSRRVKETEHSSTVSKPEGLEGCRISQLSCGPIAEAPYDTSQSDAVSMTKWEGVIRPLTDHEFARVF